MRDITPPIEIVSGGAPPANRFDDRRIDVPSDVRAELAAVCETVVDTDRTP
jgi:hypothetical protein